MLLLESKVVESQYNPASVDAQLANVPRNTLSFWSTYKLPRRIEAGGGGEFVGSRAASSTAPTDPTTGLVKEVPGYWEFNAMAKYPLTERLSLQLNVYNLADKYYYDEIHPGHIIPGAGRSASISLIFKF
ncbi:MAG: TonB-dependent receptor domain-containing protein [Terriglobia bacterium]